MRGFIERFGSAMVVCSFILIGCGKTPTEPISTYPNLLPNPNFQISGQASLKYWIADSTMVKIVQDTSPGGGPFSLRISAGSPPIEGYAQTLISGQSGTGIYRLSLWAKSISKWVGTVDLALWSHSRWSYISEVKFDSTAWTHLTLIDTISCTTSDSIGVTLSAGWGEALSGTVLFGNVVLQRIQ